MRKEKRNSAIFVLIIILVIFILTIGIIFALKPKTNNVVKENNVSYVGETKTVSIKSLVSVSDKFGKGIEEDNGGSFGYLTFDVVNNTYDTQKYQIYITKKDLEKELNSRYIVFYLTDDQNQPYEGYTTNILPTYYSFYGIKDKPASKSIYTGTLEGNEKAHFVLRVWIAENYVISDLDEGFSFKIDARSI